MAQGKIEQYEDMFLGSKSEGALKSHKYRVKRARELMENEVWDYLGSMCEYFESITGLSIYDEPEISCKKFPNETKIGFDCLSCPLFKERRPKKTEKDTTLDMF